MCVGTGQGAASVFELLNWWSSVVTSSGVEMWACRLEDSPSRFPLVLLTRSSLRGTRFNRSPEMHW